MTWKISRTQSHWREFNYMLNQIKRAIEPVIPLLSVIAKWRGIARELAEAPRKRKGQMVIIELQV